MRVTALGTSAAYPGPDNACTGWLVEEGDSHVLIDCGTGVVSRLQRILPLERLTAMVITHMHADHFFDLFPLRYGYKYGLGVPDPPPALYLPPGGQDTLQSVAGTLDEHDAAGFFPAVFRLTEFDPKGQVAIDGLTIRFAPGQHYVPCWALSIEGDRRVVFTADTAPAESVTKLAAGADLLISEATYLSLEEEWGPQRGHMTGREAGQLALQADPKSTLLTHHWPHREPRQSLEQAQEVFRGQIAVAEAGRSYEI